MSADTVRILSAGGIFMVLLLLRLEANRFGTAEYAEPGVPRSGLATRLSWYLIGFALLVALYVVHPAPHDVLILLAGHGADIAANGAILSCAGLGLTATLAWLRYGYLRFPPASAHPAAGLNSIATAIIDEAVFRGALLGTLVALGVPGPWAVALETVGYVLIVRGAAPGRHYSVLVTAVFLGVAGGWATLASGGIGAAIIGHAVTSFGLFVCTGHAGQVPPGGSEPEEVTAWNRPAGWRDARLIRSRSGAGPVEEYEPIGPSGFSNRAARGTAGRSAGLLAWIRSGGRGQVDRPVVGPAAARAAAGHAPKSRVIARRPSRGSAGRRTR